MSFLWPPMLALLVLVPLGIALHATLERRRRSRVASFAGLGLAAPVGRRPSALRRRLPGALVVLGLTTMLVALARPQAVVSLPVDEGTVVLLFDVSGSMAADDLKPTRMEAAKAAAKAFVEHQPAGVVIGVVAFSESGISAQVPTKDQATVLGAINRLAPQRGTSVGQGILVALNAIALAEAGDNPDYYSNRSPAPSASVAPVPAGSHTQASIVLLSDGENTVNPAALPAAQAAADRGVRIYTVGIGTPAGADLKIEGFSDHTQLDQAALQQVSQVTAGTYLAVDDQAGLARVYDDLGSTLSVKPQKMEITSILAGGSLVLLLAGGLSSLAWLGRLP